jgi:hypothetical protein
MFNFLMRISPDYPQLSALPFKAVLIKMPVN